MQELIQVLTTKKQELIDITEEINSIIKTSKINEGLCIVYAMHATAAIIVNENADPNICLDLLDSLNGLIPPGKWRHDKLDGNADAHIKASILGPSETIPVKNNGLQLGAWQSPMFVELDGPRQRRIVVSILGD
jgi:secondary thiamine-phosphate synthase enzyme